MENGANVDDAIAAENAAVDYSSEEMDESDMEAAFAEYSVVAGAGTKRRRIEPNPSAGAVRARELHCAWMLPASKRIELENEKAAAIIFDKRVFNLAKQTAAGLAGIQIRYEMTSLANIIRDACRFREQGSSLARGNPKRLKELELSLEIYDACLRFDMPAVARLLGIDPRLAETSSNDQFVQLVGRVATRVCRKFVNQCGAVQQPLPLVSRDLRADALQSARVDIHQPPTRRPDKILVPVLKQNLPCSRGVHQITIKPGVLQLLPDAQQLSSGFSEGHILLPRQDAWSPSIGRSFRGQRALRPRVERTDLRLRIACGTCSTFLRARYSIAWRLSPAMPSQKPFVAANCELRTARNREQPVQYVPQHERATTLIRLSRMCLQSEGSLRWTQNGEAFSFSRSPHLAKYNAVLPVPAGTATTSCSSSFAHVAFQKVSISCRRAMNPAA
eukprot:scaffold789_cov261-Pinguiococcus_pyrenoidosus.AAC.19